MPKRSSKPHPDENVFAYDAVARLTGGKPGPITRALQDAFFGLFDGRTVDRWRWLAPVTEDALAECAVREKSSHERAFPDSRDQGRSREEGIAA